MRRFDYFWVVAESLEKIWHQNTFKDLIKFINRIPDHQLNLINVFGYKNQIQYAGQLVRLKTRVTVKF